MAPSSVGRSSATTNSGPPDSDRDGGGPVEIASASIPVDERTKLWVRSGGRCAICNEYLLENEFTGHVLNVGEMAHNVGRRRSERSPRGMDHLPVEERNKAENLLLLCDRDHKTIDNVATRGDWPVERLQQIKRVHEDRIRYLTGLRENAETVVLRVIVEVQDAGAVELSHATVIRPSSSRASSTSKTATGHARRGGRCGPAASGCPSATSHRSNARPPTAPTSCLRSTCSRSP
jgi:hypothetical protein